MIGIPSAFALIISIVARRQPVMIELCAPIFVGATSIVVVVLNMFMHDGDFFRFPGGDIDPIRFKAQIWVIYTSCFISVFFLTPSYMMQVVARMLLGPPILWITFFYNDNLFEDKFNQLAIPATLVALIMAEGSLYISYKARAKLYLESQMNKQQQEQLSNLLDTVPDSVVIFSKSTE